MITIIALALIPIMCGLTAYLYALGLKNGARMAGTVQNVSKPQIDLPFVPSETKKIAENARKIAKEQAEIRKEWFFGAEEEDK